MSFAPHACCQTPEPPTAQDAFTAVPRMCSRVSLGSGGGTEVWVDSAPTGPRFLSPGLGRAVQASGGAC